MRTRTLYLEKKDMPAAHRHAEVTETAGSICVKERGVLSEGTTCFLKPQAREGLPDGELTGKTKKVAVTLADGRVQDFHGSITGLVSASKEGGEVVVRQGGLFSQTELGRIPAGEAAAVTAEDCLVCKALNPFYK